MPDNRDDLTWMGGLLSGGDGVHAPRAGLLRNAEVSPAPYVFQLYPRCLYRASGESRVVEDAAEQAALGEGWYGHPNEAKAAADAAAEAAAAPPPVETILEMPAQLDAPEDISPDVTPVTVALDEPHAPRAALPGASGPRLGEVPHAWRPLDRAAHEEGTQAQPASSMEAWQIFPGDDRSTSRRGRARQVGTGIQAASTGDRGGDDAPAPSAPGMKPMRREGGT